jgi:hypothetical protein
MLADARWVLNHDASKDRRPAHQAFRKILEKSAKRFFSLYFRLVKDCEALE